MHLNQRLRILFDQRSDATGLGAREELADHSAGGQVDRVLFARIVNRRTILGDVEPCTAVGEVERSTALGDRVVAAVLEQSRRAGMVVDRGAGAWVLAIARPEDPELLRDLLVRHARVIRDAAFAGDAQLLEDLARTGEGETMRPVERLRDVLDDAPILMRVPRAVHGLVDLDDATLDLRDGAFILFVQAPGQNDVGVPGRVVEKEVDGRVELELLKAARDKGVVRQRHLRVETDRQQALDLTTIDLAEQLVGVNARTRHLLLVDSPHTGDVLPVLGVADVTQAWELIALLPVLAAALPVGLSDDGAVAALRLADSPGREHEVDRAERVLHAVRMVLDATGVKEEARLRGTPPLGGQHQGTLRHAGHLRGPRQRPLPAVLCDLLETHRVRIDERVIQPVALDHDLQHAREQGRVAPRLHRQVQIAGPSGRCDTRILDDDLRALLARLPHVVGGNGRTFGDVRAGDPDHVGAHHVGPRVRRAVDAERLLVRGASADHAEAAVVVDERRLQADACELAEQIGLLGSQAGATEEPDGPG